MSPRTGLGKRQAARQQEAGERESYRCGTRKGLQIDHITPFANGGRIDMSNLRLLCGAHNRRAAELNMGMQVMQPYWRNQ